MSSVPLPPQYLESIEFRRAEEPDSFPAFAIRRRAILGLAPSRISATEARQWADEASLQIVSRAIARHAVWVATRADRVIGWVESSENRILRLFIDPADSGDGIRTHLLEQAEFEIERDGYPEVILESHWIAASFYKSNGYHQRAKGLPNAPIALRKKLPASH